jgi:hypothetical protein
MGIRTGKPRGRPKGAKNLRSQKVEQAAAEAAERIAEVIPGAFEGDAHALLMTVYKNPENEWPLRVDAAKAAIRYEKPALSSIEAKVDAAVKASVRRIERVVIDPTASDA